MQQKRIVKVTERMIRLENVHSIGVIGDPGCEGLGASHMRVYAGALEECGRDDLTLIVGDLVPDGTEQHYHAIEMLTEALAKNDVYALRGNHDTGAYTDFFGRKNYALLTERFAVIVLDNAMRTFEEEGLSLLAETLALESVHQAIIAFHIPTPNHFIKNCVSEAEFSRLQAAYAPWKSKVKYLLCGHVHSRFVDAVDGIPLICTGGGGAVIENVSKEIRACDVEHHVVHFFEKENVLEYQIANLSEGRYRRECDDPIANRNLQEAVQGELLAHFKYLMFADRAERRGMYLIANLFRALAASEYYHARNFYAVFERPTPFLASAEAFLPEEKFEHEHFYRMMSDYARDRALPLTEQAYTGAAAAEAVHAALLEEAAAVETFAEDMIYVCPICGYVMTGKSAPERCPICGGSQRQYQVFSSREC